MQKAKGGEGDSVKVAVRVRPFNEREQSASQNSVVTMRSLEKTVTITNPAQSGGSTKFPFDNVFWSLHAPDDDGKDPAGQGEVYAAIGKPLIEHAFGGYNSCLFAYGQTGSGKTHTMMGGGSFDANHPDAGVIPRLCKDLFDEQRKIEEAGASRWTVKVGFIEVYNEKVSDLLAERGAKTARGGKAEDVILDVREHPQHGVFAEGQEFKAVKAPEEIAKLIEQGNDVRHVAATSMNNRSSRSHAIFQILLTEERLSTGTGGKSSRMNLVDLAGSERVSQSQVVGQQFSEAKFINLSLTTLGRVIDVLADRASKKSGGTTVPPYRDSKLTLLLRDSLGGNSKTFMVAAVSPSALNYEESLSTLRYASRARDIVNTAKMNEDPRARKIRELEEEMARMRTEMKSGDAGYVSNLEERLRLLESEAQRRAADLHAVELEREQNEMQKKMLKATEAEKQQLQSKADELERQMKNSRAQSEVHQRELQRLQDLQAARELEYEAKDAAYAAMQRNVEHGQEDLKRAMDDLDREKASKQEALRKLEHEQSRLQEALQTSQQSAEQRAMLEKQNEDLLSRMRDIEREAESNARLKEELIAFRAKLENANSRVALLLHELEEADHRRGIEVAALLGSADALNRYCDASLEKLALRLEQADSTQEILRREAATLQLCLETSNASLNTLQAEKAALAATLAERTTTVESRDATIATLTEEKAALEKKLSEAVDSLLWSTSVLENERNAMKHLIDVSSDFLSWVDERTIEPFFEQLRTMIELLADEMSASRKWLQTAEKRKKECVSLMKKNKVLELRLNAHRIITLRLNATREEMLIVTKDYPATRRVVSKSHADPKKQEELGDGGNKKLSP